MLSLLLASTRKTKQMSTECFFHFREWKRKTHNCFRWHIWTLLPHTATLVLDRNIQVWFSVKKQRTSGVKEATYRAKQASDNLRQTGKCGPYRGGDLYAVPANQLSGKVGNPFRIYHFQESPEICIFIWNILILRCCYNSFLNTIKAKQNSTYRSKVALAQLVDNLWL